jgi:hypothetical protein
MKHFYDKYPSTFLYLSDPVYYPEDFFNNLYKNNSHYFSKEFKEFLIINRYSDIRHNDFKIYNDKNIIFSLFRLRYFPEYEFTNPIHNISSGLLESAEDYGFRFDDFDKFFEIGSTVENQPVLIGIADPYIDQVFLINCIPTGWFADEPIRTDPDGLQVLPMHFLAPTFEAFIDLLYKNSNAFLENNNK